MSQQKKISRIEIDVFYSEEKSKFLWTSKIQNYSCHVKSDPKTFLKMINNLQKDILRGITDGVKHDRGFIT